MDVSSAHLFTPADLDKLESEIIYSNKFQDDVFEYCTVIVPFQMLKIVRPHMWTTLMKSSEWRSCGINMSKGWQHFEIHRYELNVLLFRRPIGTDGQTGSCPRETHDRIRKRLQEQRVLEELRAKALIDLAAKRDAEEYAI